MKRVMAAVVLCSAAAMAGDFPWSSEDLTALRNLQLDAALVERATAATLRLAEAARRDPALARAMSKAGGARPVFTAMGEAIDASAAGFAAVDAAQVGARTYALVVLAYFRLLAGGKGELHASAYRLYREQPELFGKLGDAHAKLREVIERTTAADEAGEGGAIGGVTGGVPEASDGGFKTYPLATPPPPPPPPPGLRRKRDAGQ